MEVHKEEVMRIEKANDKDIRIIDDIVDGMAFLSEGDIWIATKEYYSDEQDFRYRRCVRLCDGYVDGFAPIKEVKLVNAKVVVE